MNTPPDGSTTDKPEEYYLDKYPTDRDVPRLDRQWLSGRSQDELINIILELRERLPKRTAQLDADIVSSTLGQDSTGAQDFVREFTRVPAAPARKRADATNIAWRIVLRSSNPIHQPLGLEIVDDAFVGRAAAGITPDLDLTPCDAEKQGVSRQHALFRPTKNKLLLIDLGSTNGTFRNGVQLEAGIAQALEDNDTITFATLHLTVTFVSQPQSKPA